MAARVGCLVLAAWAGACSGSPTSPTPASRPVSAPASATPALGLSCPDDVSATAPLSTVTAVASFTTPSATEGTPPVTVTCTPASGSTFTVGTTAVSCTATDAVGQTATCGFTVRVNPPQPVLLKTTFLAFGDSLTSGEVTEPLSDAPSLPGPFASLPVRLVPSASYPTQLLGLLTAAYPQQSGISVTTAGRSGELAMHALPRLETEMRTTNPQVVLLLSGYNDLVALDTAGIPTAARGVEAMAKAARLRGAFVFIATLPPPRPPGRLAPPAATVTRYNDRLRVVATGEQAVIVDLHAAMRGHEAAYIGHDGVHPTEAGYLQMANTFFAAIKARLEVR